jgi:probable phosphoglycerate mutase
MSRPPELWIARHGETEWTHTRRHTGTTDIPLTAQGEEQARALAGRLEQSGWALVLSSPLRRALDTARLAGFEPEVDDRLREFDYGDYEGLTTAQIHEQRPDWDLWRDGCPGGEQPGDVGGRMDGVIERLRAAGGDGGRVLAFGHGHGLRVLTARWLGLPAVEGRAFLLPTAGIGVLGSEHGIPAVARWGL